MDGSGSSLTFQRFRRLVLILTGLAAASFLAQAFHYLPVISDNEYPETAGVVSAQHWARSGSLYSDFHKPPYIVTGFPPLWYAFLVGIARASSTELDAMTWMGRFINLASLLLLMVATYLWSRRLGCGRGPSLLVPLFYLTVPMLIPWSVAARPDFPSLLFSVLAVIMATGGSRAVWIFLAALVAATSFLMKQSAVAAPTALVLWLVWSRRWKHAAWFCTVWFAIVAFVLGFFDLASNGLLRLNISGTHFGHVALGHAHEILVHVLAPPGNGFLYLLIACGLAGFSYSWRDPRSEIRLLSVYLATSLFFAGTGSLVAGGNVNYYLEPFLTLALFMPLLFERLEKEWKPDSVTAFLFLFVFLVVSLPTLDLLRWRALNARPVDHSFLVSLVKGKQVLSDIPYVAARSATPEFLDPVSLVYEERRGGWSSEEIVRRVDRQTYDYVILESTVDDPRRASPRYQTLSPPLRKAIQANYTLCFEKNSAFVYAPRKDFAQNSPPSCPERASQ